MTPHLEVTGSKPIGGEISFETFTFLHTARILVKEIKSDVSQSREINKSALNLTKLNYFSALEETTCLILIDQVLLFTEKKTCKKCSVSSAKAQVRTDRYSIKPLNTH